MTFATHWFCLACGHRARQSSGWPCGQCESGPVVRIVVREPSA